MSRLLIALLLAVVSTRGLADASLPNETQEQYDRRAQWFRDAKVGVFIHWNPSVIIEKEISWCRDGVGREFYDGLYKRFDPKRFDADEWIRIFHDAGIRYAVFVPKHHDGFAMFRTKTYDYNVLNTPFGRDFTKEVAEACRKGGVKFCLYYSVLDWWNPDYNRNAGHDLTNYVERTFKPHMRELLTQYGPVGAIWFDGNWEPSWNRAHALDVAKLIRELQPELLIGNRLEPKARVPNPELRDSDEPGVRINGDLPFVSSFYDAPDAIGDYQAREMMWGHYFDKKAWDSCYNFAPTPSAPNGAWSWLAGAKPRPLDQIVNWIVKCVVRDGNALLGIGPKPDGTIDEASAARLKELGAWLRANGEAIYGTRGGPWLPGDWGGSTRRGKKAYLLVQSWPGETLRLPALPVAVTGAKLLGGQAVGVSKVGGMLEFRVPQGLRTPMVTILEVSLAADVMRVAPVAVPEPKVVSHACPVTVSSFWYGRPELSFAHLTDGNPSTIWASAEPERAATVTVDLGQSRRISEVRISDAPYGRVRRFDVEVETSAGWRKVGDGASIGPDRRVAVPDVAGTKVRINLRESTDTPTLAEVTVLGY